MVDNCQKLNLKFLKPDKGTKKWRLKDIWGVNAEGRVQLIVESLDQEERALIMSWDLVRNVEDRHTEANINDLII